MLRKVGKDDGLLFFVLVRGFVVGMLFFLVLGVLLVILVLVFVVLVKIILLGS